MSVRIKNFYGRRIGRPLSKVKQDLMDHNLPLLQIHPTLLEGKSNSNDYELNFNDIYTQPVQHIMLEVGYGQGEHLSYFAANHPQWGIIGADPFTNGTAELLKNISGNQIDNIRLWNDSIHSLMPCLPAEQIDKIVILFPDPWPKLRHHKRRLIQPQFIDHCVRILKVGGRLIIGTDHADYRQWIIAAMRTQHNLQPCFAWTHLPQVKPYPWPLTTYERKAHAAGRSCHYLEFSKRALASSN